MSLKIVTGNANKVVQMAHHLEQPLQQVDIDLPEIQAVQVSEVIEEKAWVAYRQVGHPVLVEDTGLYIKAWNGLPGALIRWFLQSVDNEGICRMLNDFEDRGARAETCIGFCDGEAFRVFSGVVEGAIALSPRGEYGFGWDPIFVPSGSDQTFAEVPPEQKVGIDMRRLAAHKLKMFLEQQ